MTDRELIDRLLFLAQTAVDQALDLNYDDPEDYFIYRELRELKAAVAAQPEPQGPTDEELYDYWISTSPEFGCADPVGFARAVLARYGRPAIEPVPVSERLPGPEDCDLFERVWAFNPVLDHWKVTRINQSIHTHWLPHWALPKPGVEGADG
jgi:hypothetical protein